MDYPLRGGGRGNIHSLIDDCATCTIRRHPEGPDKLRRLETAISFLSLSSMYPTLGLSGTGRDFAERTLFERQRTSTSLGS